MYTEILGEEHRPSPYTSERIDYGPSQIRDITELKPDMVVVKHGTYYTKKGSTPYEAEYRIIGNSYQNQSGEWWIATEHMKTKIISQESLADMGIVQYGNDLWNKSNWLEDPSKVPAPQE